MAFIPRPNLPEGLASQLVQLIAQMNNPIAEGISSAGKSIGAGLGARAEAGNKLDLALKEAQLRLEADRNKEFLNTISKIATEGKLSAAEPQSLNLNMGLPQAGMGLPKAGIAKTSNFTTEDIWKAMGSSGPMPGRNYRVTEKQDLSKITVTPEIAKKYAGLQEGSQIPSTFLADYDLKLKDADFKSKMKELDLAIKKARLDAAKDKDGDKTLDRLIKVRQQAVQELQKSTDQVGETIIKDRVAKIDADIGKYLPGFNTDMENDIRQGQKAIALGKLNEAEVNKRLMSKYPQLTDVMKKKPGFFASLFGAE